MEAGLSLAGGALGVGVGIALRAATVSVAVSAARGIPMATRALNRKLEQGAIEIYTKRTEVARTAVSSLVGQLPLAFYTPPASAGGASRAYVQYRGGRSIAW